MLAVSSRRDVDAFEVIFKHFAPRVKAYMAKLSADTQAAEELMQETMIAVWNKADQFDVAKGALSTWIFTIARNQRIDAVRRARRPEFDPTDPAFVPDEEQLADLSIAERQSASQLRAAMADLPKEQSVLLELAYFEERTHSAIAKLNLPLGTVKSRLRLAFNKLRAALDSRERTDGYQASFERRTPFRLCCRHVGRGLEHRSRHSSCALPGLPFKAQAV